MDYKNYIQYHNTKAIDKNGLIGICMLWGYKNIIRFGNEKFQSVGWIDYPLTAFETGDLILITNDEFNSEYKKRNVYSDDNERTKSYGVIHDSLLAAIFDGRTTQPFWSRDFCISFASTYANLKVIEDCQNKFNSIDKDFLTKNHKDEFKKIVLKHHLNFDACTYTDKLDEIDEGKISFDDVMLQIEEFKKMPIEWRSSIKSELDDLLK